MNFAPCYVQTVNSYSISVTAVGKGSVSSSQSIRNCTGTCQERVDGDTHIVLSASSESGSPFKGWTGAAECAGKSDNSIEILPKHVLINCYAHFE